MPPLVADTGGLLRALARRPDGRPAWPDYERALTQASAVIVPGLILAEVDYFLRAERAAMRKLIREIVDPATTYELEPVSAADLARAAQLDAKFQQLQLGLVDGVVAAVAERRRINRVLTADRRDFATLRVGARYTQALMMLPSNPVGEHAIIPRACERVQVAPALWSAYLRRHASRAVSIGACSELAEMLRQLLETSEAGRELAEQGCLRRGPVH